MRNLAIRWNQSQQKIVFFSVDAIRVGADKFVAGETPLYDVLCIDDFDVKGKDWSNCTLITQGDLSMSLGVSIGADVKKKGGVGSVSTFHIGAGIAAGYNILSVDVPWVIGIPLRQEQANYKGGLIGGNILQDSGIGGVKAKEFVVVTIARNGISGDISFLGKKPHNMELFLGITGDDKRQTCWSELALEGGGNSCFLAPSVPDSLRLEFEDALDSGCLTCPLAGAHDPNPQNTIAADPEGSPILLLSGAELAEMLDVEANLEFVSDFALALPDVLSDISGNVLEEQFNKIDVDMILTELEDAIIEESSKIEQALIDLIDSCPPDDLCPDLTSIVDQIDELQVIIDAIIADITSVASKWDFLKSVFGL